MRRLKTRRIIEVIQSIREHWKQYWRNIRLSELEVGFSILTGLIRIRRASNSALSRSYQINDEEYGKFVGKQIRVLGEFVEYEAENEFYGDIFIQYEDVIHTIANTVESSMELTDGISVDMREDVISLLNSFGKTLKDRQQSEFEDKAKQELMKLEEMEIIEKSLLGHLRFELDYVSSIKDNKQLSRPYNRK